MSHQVTIGHSGTGTGLRRMYVGMESLPCKKTQNRLSLGSIKKEMT